MRVQFFPQIIIFLYISDGPGLSDRVLLGPEIDAKNELGVSFIRLFFLFC